MVLYVILCIIKDMLLGDIMKLIANKIWLFIVLFLVAYFMCYGYVSGHYSTDDYNIMNVGYNYYSIHNNLIEGRPVMFLIDQLYNLFNISYDTFIKSTVTIAILFTVLNIFLFYDLIEKYFKNKKILWIILFSTIFNFMYLENLYFVESIVMSFSLVFYTLSAKYFFLEGEVNIIKSLLFNILAIFCYNAFECYFIVIVSLISLMKNGKINKNLFISIFKAGLIVIVSVLLNYVQIVIVNKLLLVDFSRVYGSIFNNFLIVIYYGIPKIVFGTCNLLPKFMFFISLILLLFLSFINKNRDKIFVENVFLAVICILSSFCPSIFTLSSLGTGRIVYGIGMTIGILLLNFLKNTENKKLFLYLVVFLSIVWTSINIINYSSKTYLSKKQNEIEKKEILKLDKAIKKYENDNDIVVDTCVSILVVDYNETSVILENALNAEWSVTGAINYYSRRKLRKEVLIEDEAKEYIKLVEKNNYYIDNNKLYLIITDW